MMRIWTTIAVLAACLTVAKADSAKTLCTIIADSDGRVLLEQGPACRERVTPASTFKVPLAVMGFDAGILTGPNAPVWPFRKGYPDWGGARWRQPTEPIAWMHNSVVWYSQRITERLGEQRLSDYATSFGYGNADFSGDLGKNNGLERAWIGSSLKISPREQAVFIARLAGLRLPNREASRHAIELLEVHKSAGWAIRGKTGSAFPRLANGELDRAHGWGWYVGWAEKAGSRLVIVRLRQDTERQKQSGGLRTRATILGDWARLVADPGVAAILK